MQRSLKEPNGCGQLSQSERRQAEPNRYVDHPGARVVDALTSRGGRTEFQSRECLRHEFRSELLRAPWPRAHFIPNAHCYDPDIPLRRADQYPVDRGDITLPAHTSGKMACNQSGKRSAPSVIPNDTLTYQGADISYQHPDIRKEP